MMWGVPGTHGQSKGFVCAQIPLYEQAGFGLVGPSDVQHGQDQWYEMAIDIE